MSLHQSPGRFILCSGAPPTATPLRLILPTTTTTTTATTIGRNSHLCSTGNGGSPSSNGIKWFQSTTSVLYNLLTLLNSCCWVWQLSLVLFHFWKNIMVYLDQLLYNLWKFCCYKIFISCKVMNFLRNVFTSITILLYGEYMMHILYEQKYYYMKISLTHTKNCERN